MIKTYDNSSIKIPIKKMFIFYITLFILGIVIGFFFTSGATIQTVNPTNTFFGEIFINNFYVSLSLLLGGLLTFGVLSGLIIIVNGAVVGELIKVLYIHKSLESLISGLIPHLILELPALVMFAIIGTFSGHFLFLFLKSKHTSTYILIYSKMGIQLLILGVFLLFIASLIEDYISFVDL